MKSRRYPPLPAKLADQLSSVEPADGLYRPCIVTLLDGSVLDRVYIADAQPWIGLWGVWPEDDRGKLAIGIDSVASIADSPSRLPAKFADALDAAGESGMGYTIFTVQFENGSSSAVMTGNAIDFIIYPPGQSKDTVVNVLPHVGRDDPHHQNGPPYHWCLYDGVSAD